MIRASFKISSGFLIMIFLVSVFAPWIIPYSYKEQDTLNLLSFPSSEHWLGTDRLGRDLMSRMIYGARVSLVVGVFSTLLALIFGTVYGAVSGSVGGRTDNCMMRVGEVVFAFPVDPDAEPLTNIWTPLVGSVYQPISISSLALNIC